MDQGSKPSNLIVSTKDGGVAVVELNRPKKRNALSQALIDELIEVLSHLERDETVSTAILTSSGPFSGNTASWAHLECARLIRHLAGADLVELAALTTVEAYAR